MRKFSVVVTRYAMPVAPVGRRMAEVMVALSPMFCSLTEVSGFLPLPFFFLATLLFVPFFLDPLPFFNRLRFLRESPERAFLSDVFVSVDLVFLFLVVPPPDTTRVSSGGSPGSSSTFSQYRWAARTTAIPPPSIVKSS